MTPPHRPPPPSTSPHRSPRLSQPGLAGDYRRLPLSTKSDRRTAHSPLASGDERRRHPSQSQRWGIPSGIGPESTAMTWLIGSRIRRSKRRTLASLPRPGSHHYPALRDETSFSPAIRRSPRGLKRDEWQRRRWSKRWADVAWQRPRQPDGMNEILRDIPPRQGVLPVTSGHLSSFLDSAGQPSLTSSVLLPTLGEDARSPGRSKRGPDIKTSYYT